MTKDDVVDVVFGAAMIVAAFAIVAYRLETFLALRDAWFWLLSLR